MCVPQGAAPRLMRGEGTAAQAGAYLNQRRPKGQFPPVVAGSAGGRPLRRRGEGPYTNRRAWPLQGQGCWASRGRSGFTSLFCPETRLRRPPAIPSSRVNRRGVPTPIGGL